MKNIIKTTFGLILLSCGAINAKSVIIEENLSLSGVKTITINSDTGDVNIIQERRTDVHVELETTKGATKLIVEEGSNLKVRVKRPFFGTIPYSAKLTVRVPSEYSKSLNINASSGDVSISELELYNLKVNLSSGHFNGSEFKIDEAKISNSSGHINLNNSDIKKLILDASSGHIKLDGFTGKIEGQSSSGNVDIILDDLIDDIKFRLSSGKFTLKSPNSKIDARLNLRTSSGIIKADFPVTIDGMNKNNSLEGISGEGKYSFDVQNSSGNIELYSN